MAERVKRSVNSLEPDVAKVLTALLSATSGRRDFEAWWIRSVRHYELELDRRYEGYGNVIFVPWTHALVENQVARLMNTVFSARPIIALSGRYGEIDERVATEAERFLDFIITHPQADFYRSFEGAAFDSCLLGTGILGLVPRQEMSPIGPVVLPTFIHVPIAQFYVDPRATSLSDARFVIRRVVMSKEELEAHESRGWTIPRNMPYGSYPEWYYASLRSVLSPDVPMWLPPTYEAVEVLEYWLPDRVYYVAGRFAVVYEEELPYGRVQWPFVRFFYDGLRTQFYGIGLGRLLYYLQEDQNHLRMQRRHAMELVNNPVFVTTGTAEGFDKPIGPGTVLVEDVPGSIRRLDMGDVSSSSFLEEQTIGRDMQMGSGEFDYLLGIPPRRGREAATTVMRLQQAALNRFTAWARRISTDSMVDLARKLLVWTVSAVRRDFYELVIGSRDSGLYAGGIDRIITSIDVKALGGVDVDFKAQKLQNFLQVVPQLLQSPFVKPEKIIQRLMTYVGIEEPEELVLSPEEAEALRAQIFAAQAARTRGRGE